MNDATQECPTQRHSAACSLKSPAGEAVLKLIVQFIYRLQFELVPLSHLQQPE